LLTILVESRRFLDIVTTHAIVRVLKLLSLPSERGE
jgi:hypothetical protein